MNFPGKDGQKKAANNPSSGTRRKLDSGVLSCQKEPNKLSQRKAIKVAEKKAAKVNLVKTRRKKSTLSRQGGSGETNFVNTSRQVRRQLSKIKAGK